jgi:predicted O-methyltransferase YrrM
MRPEVNAHLRSLYNREPQKGSDGKLHELAEIPCMHRERAEALADLFRRLRPARSAEVGFAYGHSTIHILSVMEEEGFGHHTAIDPYQEEWWHGIGSRAVADLKLADRFRFMQRLSFVAFAAMHAQRERVDFLFIDGDHKIDFTMADLTFGDQVLSPNGVVVLDDGWMPAVQKVAAFVRTNLPHYQEIDSGDKDLIAFQKTGTDQREWDHYAEF